MAEYIGTAIIIGTLVYFIFFKPKIYFPCAIPVVSIICDFVVMHLAPGDSSVVQYARACGMLCGIGIYCSQKLSINRVTISVFLFLFYVFVLIVMRGIVPSGEFLVGIRWLGKVGLSMLLLIIGFEYIYTFDSVKLLTKYTIYAGFIFIFYVAVVNIFGIGTNVYVKNELVIIDDGIIRTGMFSGVSFYTVSIILILAPIIYETSREKFKPINLQILFFVLGVLLILILRRSAILIVVAGYLSYIFLFRKEISLRKGKKIILNMVALSIMTMPFLIPYAKTMIAIRGKNTISLSAFEQDVRAKEIPYIIYKTLNSNEQRFLFGKSFKTQGAFPFASLDRSLHSDISVLLYVTGSIGLLLYILVNYSIISFCLKYREYSTQLFSGTVIVLVISNLLLMYPGRLTAITPKSIMFLYIGSFLGLIYNTNIRKEKSGVEENKTIGGMLDVSVK